MKILPTKNLKISSCSIVKRIKNFFLPKETKLQKIEKDVFEKTIDDGVKKMPEKKLGMPRRLPNCTSGPDEYDHLVPGGGGEVCYFPEDIEKIKNMTISERFEYEVKLLKEHRYYFPEKKNYENPTN